MSVAVHNDFWSNSGYHLLEHDSSGYLTVTDDFLRAYYLRPEVRPLEDSSSLEIDFHEALMEFPRMRVSDEGLSKIEDADVRDNYRVIFSFREQLLKSSSLEACYKGIFSEGNVSVPPLIIDQMAHVILRNVLDGSEDALQLRVAELFFRKQRASVQDGAVMLADFDVVEAQASGSALGSIGRLIADTNTPIRQLSLDVLERENAELYWGRDERHDFVVRLNHGAPAAQSMCKVLESWIAHFFEIAVKVRSISSIEEARWAWHIGLDADSTALLNELWQGSPVRQDQLKQLLALYRIDFEKNSDMRADVAGRPVYLGLSMDAEGIVRMKPQNLLINMPTSRRF